ncbi:MAG: sulfite exporter TauE/SafE family protein [Gemmataceae bacterium]|nr:sulfite exporter TauE/SafE family protein [Gemmataceae bacterium]
MPPLEILLVALLFVVAMLYSSVGHAGASGYLAVLAFFSSLDQSVAKPTALALNILVATITVAQFARAGHFSWRLLLPFLLGSMPFAFYGGSITLPVTGYKLVVAFALLVASLRLLMRTVAKNETAEPPRVVVAIPAGAGVGLLAGLTGTGGGVFLTPLIIFFRWADTKAAAGVSAAFILGNSLAGLAGIYSKGTLLPWIEWKWLAAAGVGGLIGSYFGSKKFDVGILRKLLGVALLVAVVKLVKESLKV